MHTNNINFEKDRFSILINSNINKAFYITDWGVFPTTCKDTFKFACQLALVMRALPENQVGKELNKIGGKMELIEKLSQNNDETPPEETKRF